MGRDYLENLGDYNDIRDDLHDKFGGNYGAMQEYYRNDGRERYLASKERARHDAALQTAAYEDGVADGNIAGIVKGAIAGAAVTAGVGLIAHFVKNAFDDQEDDAYEEYMKTERAEWALEDAKMGREYKELQKKIEEARLKYGDQEDVEESE